MAARYVLSRPGSKRVIAPSPTLAPDIPVPVVPVPAIPAPVVSPHPITSHVRFHYVERLHMFSRSWEATAKIISGRIKNTRRGDIIYRAILADLSGDKMEAVAYGRMAQRCNNELHIGKVYLFTCLGFEMAEAPPQFGLTIPTDYYIVMNSRTQICLARPTISIPRLPSRFMEFNDAPKLRNKQLADVIGIVVDVSPVRFHKSFDCSTPCRDVMLMNIRREFLCLRIWDKHVARHMLKWRRAEQEMSILAATLFEVSMTQGALKSTDESHIVFEPDNLLAYELIAYRSTLGPTRGTILSQVRAFVQQRLTMGYYTNLRLGRL